MVTHFKHISDETEIVQRIRNSMRWDKRINNADFELMAQGQTIVVAGKVDSSFKKKAALEIIGNTEGVWQIEDYIVVPVDFYRSDEEVLKILSAQISELVKVGGEYIEITVLKGEVTLEGEVYRPRLKAMASAFCWELSGVRDVHNFIRMKGPPHQVPLDFDEEVFGIYDGPEERLKSAGELIQGRYADDFKLQ